MSLEDQIKQTSFASQTEKAFVNINFTHSYVSSRINSRFKSYNVSVQQYNVLRILKGQHPKPVSVNDITDRMIDKMSNASRLVEKLRTKELIERKPCSFDKRQVDVCLTPKGIALLDTLNSQISELILEHSHLTQGEYETLNFLLDKLRKEED
jgi:DNA-binding MarR family transcriptional regulator